MKFQMFIVLTAVLLLFLQESADAGRTGQRKNGVCVCPPKETTSSEEPTPTSTDEPTATDEPTSTTDTEEPTPTDEPQNTCSSNGSLTGVEGKCVDMNKSDCCVAGEQYETFDCSPEVTNNTPATLTVNGFASGEDGGGAASCDGQFHENTEMVVALSTGWFDNKSRCGQNVKITANGKSVLAKVVDECDSQQGCDETHAFQPPCPNNIVDASNAVWEELGFSPSSPEYGWTEVTWTDA